MYTCPMCLRTDQGCTRPVVGASGYDVYGCTLVPTGLMLVTHPGGRTFLKEIPVQDVHFGDVHPRIKHFEAAFRFSHLSDTRLQTLSQTFARQAQEVVYQLANHLQPDVAETPGYGHQVIAEVEEGLKQLVKAKDSIVRGYSFVTNPPA